MLFRELNKGDYFAHASTFEFVFEPRQKVSIHKKVDVDPRTGEATSTPRWVSGYSIVVRFLFVDGKWIREE